MTTRDGGKGDSPRPIQNRDEFEKNWDRIFKEAEEEKVKLELEFDNDHAEILATIPFGR